MNGLQNELERLESTVIDTRNMYILYVHQMNYTLKFYLEQFIADLDKVREILLERVTDDRF